MARAGRGPGKSLTAALRSSKLLSVPQSKFSGGIR